MLTRGRRAVHQLWLCKRVQGDDTGVLRDFRHYVLRDGCSLAQVTPAGLVPSYYACHAFELSGGRDGFFRLEQLNTEE